MLEPPNSYHLPKSCGEIPVLAQKAEVFVNKRDTQCKVSCLLQ